jgi:hypothetical protein
MKFTDFPLCKNRLGCVQCRNEEKFRAHMMERFGGVWQCPEGISIGTPLEQMPEHIQNNIKKYETQMSEKINSSQKIENEEIIPTHVIHPKDIQSPPRRNQPPMENQPIDISSFTNFTDLPPCKERYGCLQCRTDAEFRMHMENRFGGEWVCPEGIPHNTPLEQMPQHIQNSVKSHPMYTQMNNRGNPMGNSTNRSTGNPSHPRGNPMNNSMGGPMNNFNNPMGNSMGGPNYPRGNPNNPMGNPMGNPMNDPNHPMNRHRNNPNHPMFNSMNGPMSNPMEDPTGNPINFHMRNPRHPMYGNKNAKDVTELHPCQNRLACVVCRNDMQFVNQMRERFGRDWKCPEGISLNTPLEQMPQHIQDNITKHPMNDPKHPMNQRRNQGPQRNPHLDRMNHQYLNSVNSNDEGNMDQFNKPSSFTESYHCQNRLACAACRNDENFREQAKRDFGQEWECPEKIEIGTPLEQMPAYIKYIHHSQKHIQTNVNSIQVDKKYLPELKIALDSIEEVIPEKGLELLDKVRFHLSPELKTLENCKYSTDERKQVEKKCCGGKINLVDGFVCSKLGDSPTTRCQKCDSFERKR